jgi:deoxyribose-phosphate aldolase
VNFPDGGEDTCALEVETRQALSDGADEIELVIPYNALAEGRPGFMETQIVRIKRICGDNVLKTVLETGALPDAETIAKAAGIALGAGADFLKTSSGAVATSNTPNRADLLLTAIAEQNSTAGFAAAQDIQTPDEALACFHAARRIRGDTSPDPKLFRIGAGTLLDELISALEGKQPKQVPGAGA